MPPLASIPWRAPRRFGHRQSHRTVDAPGALRVGRASTFGDGAWFVAQPGAIVVGDGVAFGRALTVVGPATIGDRVEGGDRVQLGDPHTGDAPQGGVHVGDGAYLGTGVIVAPGVRIGAGAVVAPGAVVEEDVPDRAHVLGAPARVVKTY